MKDTGRAGDCKGISEGGEVLQGKGRGATAGAVHNWILSEAALLQMGADRARVISGARSCQGPAVLWRRRV